MVSEVMKIQCYILLPFLFSGFFSEAQTCLKRKAVTQVLILPPTGGANVADRFLFKTLCQRGHQVTILDYEQKSGLTDDLGIHDRLSQDILHQINQFLRLKEMPTVLIGSSLGGLYASTAYAYALTDQTEFESLKWIRGIVLTAAGGSLAEILSTSNQEDVIKQRSLRFQNLQIEKRSHYLSMLNQNIFYDPMKWASPLVRSNVLMFNSTNDKVVPSATQEKLWRAWGKPKVIRISKNHLLTIAKVYFFEANRIDHFLRKTFLE